MATTPSKPAQKPAQKPGPHHDHPGHVPGDLDQHGHKDTSVSDQGQSGQHHDHKGHVPGDKDDHGHADKTSGKKK